MFGWNVFGPKILWPPWCKWVLASFQMTV
jgi:hypothetical protein